MISRIDCYRILNKIKESGVDISDALRDFLKNQQGIPKSVISFINTYRPEPVTLFYKELRKKNNKRENRLYVSLMKEENSEQERVLSLLSYISQAYKFASGLENVDKIRFYQQSSLTECSEAIYNYMCKSDYSYILNIFDAIKADIKLCLEIK